MVEIFSLNIELRTQVAISKLHNIMEQTKLRIVVELLSIHKVKQDIIECCMVITQPILNYNPNLTVIWPDSSVVCRANHVID